MEIQDLRILNFLKVLCQLVIGINKQYDKVQEGRKDKMTIDLSLVEHKVSVPGYCTVQIK